MNKKDLVIDNQYKHPNFDFVIVYKGKGCFDSPFGLMFLDEKKSN
jgi:hypothetical protein